MNRIWKKIKSWFGSWFKKDPKPISDNGGIDSTETFKVSDGDSGTISFETYGIKHIAKDENYDNSHGPEFFFFQAKGANIKKFLLYHMAGRGRSGRTYIEASVPKTDPKYYRHKECKAFHDDLPGWHKWRIDWGGGVLGITIDGKPIPEMEKPMEFHGVIEKIYVGGSDNDNRRFRGKWRNLKINGVKV